MDRLRKRASHWGAFFVSVGLSLSVLFGAAPVWAQSCPADRIDEWAQVAHVIDGDTVRLRDGRSVRFIGINTPEIGRKGQPSEPFAEQARDALKQLLGAEAKLGLRFGVERHDRYGRVLAHVSSADGRSLEAGLLMRGLAAQIVVPPNVRELACYRAAEREARDAGRGVWASIYRPQAIETLSKRARGFHLITGTVTSVADSKYSVWLNFPLRAGERLRQGVAVRIPRKDLANFPRGFLPGLVGKKIIARGWMFEHKNQLVMVVRHPAALELSVDNRPAVKLHVTTADQLKEFHYVINTKGLSRDHERKFQTAGTGLSRSE